jgi:hypothetical protein
MHVWRMYLCRTAQLCILVMGMSKQSCHTRNDSKGSRRAAMQYHHVVPYWRGGIRIS